ncbi:MAG: SCO1664 family protein [Egibacteraceae bacterium]
MSDVSLSSVAAHGWSRPDAGALLASAELTVHGRFVNASNHTTLVRVGDPELGLLAVYKPQAGERPLWDFPTGTLHHREVAACVVSDYLGWQVVPPTVLRGGPLGRGSVQLFVPHDPRRHYFALVEEGAHRDALARMAAFDVLINNADRKGSHVLLAGDGHIWGCDHGLSFHPQVKLRTVIWDFAGQLLAEAQRRDLARLRAALNDADSVVAAALADLLSPEELVALRLRAEALEETGALPDLPEEYRPYPWPPL